MTEVHSDKVKQCTLCKRTLPIEKFPFNSQRVAFGARCKDCVHESARIWAIRNRQALIAYKRTLVCEHCGMDDWRCLVFHHKDPRNKEFTIGSMGLSISMVRILQEAEKCTVLCANCHRIVHAEMKGLYKEPEALTGTEEVLKYLKDCQWRYAEEARWRNKEEAVEQPSNYMEGTWKRMHERQHEQRDK